jgi:hypothetical protein
MSSFFTNTSNKPYMHIVVVQIVIQNAKMHLITIDKQHDIDLKLYALTFKVEKYNTRTF